MEIYQVKTIYGTGIGKKELTVSVPGSKSITNRALLLATLAEVKSCLDGVLFSDDSRNFLECVRALGFETEVREQERQVTVTGCGGRIPNREASLYVGSAGTAARFLTALLGISDGCFEMDSSAQMRNRPMAPLLAALRGLGAGISCRDREGFFPFTIKGNPNPAGTVKINIDNSSQFLSALLIAFGALGRESRIEAEGSHGMAYIEMTAAMMEQFGVKTRRDGSCFVIEPGQSYQPRSYRIEPDVSAACYFYAMAPLLGISVCAEHIYPDSLQGDLKFLEFLKQMGCHVEDRTEGICVQGPANREFVGIDADMHACSDQAITLAAIAPFAKTPTTIRGIGHIRLQESDRIAGIIEALTAMGISCEELEDGIRIFPGQPKPALIHTHEDHRMAMGFSLTGLRAEGIVIEDPMCCRKTFETYFQVLDGVIGQLEAGSEKSS